VVPQAGSQAFFLKTGDALKPLAVIQPYPHRANYRS